MLIVEECLVVMIVTGMLSVEGRGMFGYDCYRNVEC